MRLYLDTNVPISLVRGEIGKNYEFMAERTKEFLSLCQEQGHALLVSDWMTTELLGKLPYCADWISDFASKNTIEFIETLADDEQTAREIQRIYGLHFADALHISLALRAKADAIVTWNKKDYDRANKIIRNATPAEFF